MTMKHCLLFCSISVGLIQLSLGMGGAGAGKGPMTDTPMGTFATTGGTAGGADCMFPFYWEDCCPHYECIDTGNVGVDWCWTVNGKWGNCDTADPPSVMPVIHAITTIADCGNDYGAECMFPFTYNGCTYYGCTTADSAQPWCITVTNPTGADPSWGCCPPPV